MSYFNLVPRIPMRVLSLGEGFREFRFAFFHKAFVLRKPPQPLHLATKPIHFFCSLSHKTSCGKKKKEGSKPGDITAFRRFAVS